MNGSRRFDRLARRLAVAALGLLAAFAASAAAAGESEASTQQRLEQAQQTQDWLGKEIHALAEQLETLRRRSQTEDMEKARQALGRAKAELEKLQAEARKLEEAIRNLTRAVDLKGRETPGGTLEEAQRKLRDAAAEKERLAAREAQLRRGQQEEAKKRDGLPSFHKLQPPQLCMMIAKSQFRPLDEKHFTVDQYFVVTGGGLQGRVRFTPIKEKSSQAIGAAAAKGGVLDATFAEASAKKGYVKFFVHPDSIAAYRAAAEEAVRRGVPQCWEPLGDPSSSDGSYEFCSGAGSSDRGQGGK